MSNFLTTIGPRGGRSVSRASAPRKSQGLCSLPLHSVMAAIAMLAAQPVCAQSMDYGALQQLFGEPVTTSATGTPQRVSDTPANMTIITADDIRRSGSRNIPEVLSRIPGLDILRSGLSAYDVGVRGYQQATQPRMLVLIDGRQVFLDDYSRTDWSNLPVNIDDIRQIEVVKGASSALFGSNAASGVINIITYSPIYDDNIVVNATVGTQRQRSVDASVTLHGAWGGLKLSAGGLDAHEFDTPRPLFDGNITPETPGGTEPPTHRYVSARSVLAAAADLKVNLELTYTRSVTNLADTTDFNVMGVQHDKSHSVRAGFDWDGKLGSISANSYLNHTRLTIFETGSGDIGYGSKINLFVAQLQDQFKIGTDHTFRVGLEYRHRDYRQYNLQTIIQKPHLVQDFLSLSGTWIWNISNKAVFSNAIRYDRQKMHQAGQINTTGLFGYDDYRHGNREISANSVLTYNPTDVDNFRLAYGRGVMIPSLMQSGYSQIIDLGIGYLIDAEGNPLLKPTVVQDVSMDYGRRIDAIGSVVKTSIFYEWSRDITAPFVFDDLILLGDQLALPSYARNVGSSHGWGGEVQVKGEHRSGVRWDASYSYARVRDGDRVRELLNYQNSAPRHHLRLILGYSTGAWEFDGSAHYVTSTAMIRNRLDGNPPVRTGGYVSLSGRIGRRIGDRFTLSLSGTNLSQKETRVSAFPAIERQLLVSLTGKF